MSNKEDKGYNNQGYEGAESNENETRKPRPLRPGTGIPPHHPQKLKQKKMSKDSVFAIDVSESKSNTDLYGDAKIAPLPEPQTDIPIFSVATTASTPWKDGSVAYDYAPSDQDGVSSASTKKHKHRGTQEKDKKKKNAEAKASNHEHLPLGITKFFSTDSESSPVKAVDVPSKSSITFKREDSEVESNFLNGRRNSNGSGMNSGEDHTDLDGSSFLRYKPKILSRHLTQSSWFNTKGKKSDHHSQIDDKKLNQRRQVSFVKNNILQRECSVYVWDKKPESTKCCCGRHASWHESHGKLDQSMSLSKWHQKTHTKTMRCDSYGEILFRGFGSSTANSPYVRVDYKTDPSVLWELMVEHWKMTKPRLIISVTGGAQHFYMKDRMKSLLKQGLVDSAVKTGAWIITGGTGTGVMKLVGEAVRDHMTVHGNSVEQKCVALGIATWGIVANRLALDGEEENGLFPATYAIEDVIAAPKKGNSPLDVNHTHYVLVDNGTEGQYGKEIELRSKLEAYISAVGTMGVSEHQVISTPAILIVVEGGIGTLNTIEQSLRRSTPVVIVKGSGRVADFVAVAYEMTLHPDPTKEDVTIYPKDFKERMTMEAHRCLADDVSNQKVSKIEAFLDILKICLTQRNLINIFDLEQSESVNDIDRAILCALLKAKKADVKSQVALALAWNRCDIARQQIFTAENVGRSDLGKWMQSRDMYDAMFTAIVQNRSDFVKLFIDNGVDLKKFLTAKTLWNVYCNALRVEGDGEASIIRHIITSRHQGWGEYLKCKALDEWDHFPKAEMLYLINVLLVHLLRDEAFTPYPRQAPFLMDDSEEITSEWKGDIKLIQPMVERISSHASQGESALEERSNGRTGFVLSNLRKNQSF